MSHSQTARLTPTTIVGDYQGLVLGKGPLVGGGGGGGSWEPRTPSNNGRTVRNVIGHRWTMQIIKVY